MNTATATADEEENSKPLGHYLNILKRRKKPMQLAALVTLGIAILAVLFWPPTYRASATILIEEQDIPQDLVRSTITGFANQEIQIISQRVLTLNTIMDIVQKYQLWEDSEIRRMPRSEIVEKFHNRMKLDVVSAEVMDPRFGRPMQATIAFTLSFDHRNPAIAQKVANALVSLYMNENLKSRTERSSTTSDFLKGEADQLSNHIKELEQKLADFKGKNEGALPELSQYNLNVIERADMELNDSKSRLSELQKRRLDIQANLTQISPYAATDLPDGQKALSDPDRLKALQSDYRNKSALYSADHPDVIRLQREIQHLETKLGKGTSTKNYAAQLRAEQDKLAQFKQTYTPDHPEVIKQQRVVDALLKDGDSSSRSDEPHADNPSYVLLDTQLKSTDADINTLQSRITELTEKIARFETYVSKAPDVEKGYTEMMRDLQTTTLKYQEIKSKQMEAELSQNLETERKGERYTLAEPPILPDDPISPNRIAILIIGIVLAAIAAAATAGISEMLDDAVKGKEELTQLLGAAPLACIPYLTLDEEIKTVSLRQKLFWMGAAVSIVLVLILIDFFYKPLDVLWFIILRRLGLNY
jgi:polysaccharide biosynthesis transport protein